MTASIVHETVIDSSQHTSTITCTAAPRVWHFSAFHCTGSGDCTSCTGSGGCTSCSGSGGRTTCSGSGVILVVMVVLVAVVVVVVLVVH